MFSPFFRRYLPGFRVGPDGVPRFNIDDNSSPRRPNVSFSWHPSDSAIATVSRRGARLKVRRHQLRPAGAAS